MNLKNVLKHTAVYGISSSLNRAAGFFLIPIYTRYLEPEEYGVLALCQAIISLLAIVFEMGMNSALFRYYFEYDDKNEKDNLIGTAFLTLITLNIILSLCIFGLSSLLAELIFAQKAVGAIIKIIGITVFVETMLRIPFIILRANNMSLHYASINFMKLLVSLSLTIYFVVCLERNILGIMESKLITACVFQLFFIPYLLKNIKFSFSYTKFKLLLKFGIPLIPTNLMGFLLAFSDRYILKLYVSFHDIGVYSLGYKFGAIINMIAVSAIALSWPAALMKLVKETDAERKIAKFSTYFVFCISLLVLLVSLYIDEILKILATSHYSDAAAVVPVIAFAYLFYALYKLFESGIFIAKKPKYYPYITFIAGSLNIGLNFILIPHWGMMAAAYNTLIAFMVLSLLTLIVANRLYPIPYEYKRILSILLVTVFILIASGMIQTDSIIASVILKSLLLVTFPGFLWLMGFFSQNEITRLKKLLQLF